MAVSHKDIPELLDAMALKLLMVEPGDLSVVGELLEMSEELLARDTISDFSALKSFAETFKTVLEKIIMTELDDSAENFDALGKCISFMQESLRKEGETNESIISGFYDSISTTGFQVDQEAGSAAQGASNTMGKQEVSLEQPLSDQNDEASNSLKETQKSTYVPDFLKDKDLLSGFIDEAFEHLEGIEVYILELEQKPDDLEIINNIFRPFHTIKGVSGFLNLKTINKLSHTTENLLDDVRNGRLSMDSEVIDVVLNVGDCIKNMVQNVKEALEKGPEYFQEFDISEFIERIHTIQNQQSSAPGTVAQEGSPPVETVATREERVSSSSSSKGEETTAVESQRIIEEKDDTVQTGAVKPKDASAGPAPLQKSKLGASIKVDIEKLDGLVNAVGELVIMQAMVRQNPLVSDIDDPKLTRDFSQLSRITTELQKTAMAMRMVPIRQTFQKMIRLVRDLSKKSGKKVDLIMSGEETEIDRNMVDSIYDPLVHMIRNSVDHGVQTPEERKKVNKPETGTVNLRAYQKGGNIVIEIEDDGQGLNTEKIKKKAVERKLINEGENYSSHEINNLIFLPGFSTADKITDVSGRGVGMDVVKKAVEKLRGNVEVYSQVGMGTQFLIRLPLTLAIIDGIIVRIGMERYVIPTIAIQESLKPERKKYKTVHGKGEALLVRDSLIPLIRLYDLFGVEPSNTDPCESIVVVVENEGQQRALMVDELLGKQEVVIKSLGGLMKDVPGVAGGTILADGRVGLILDIAGIVSSSSSTAAALDAAEDA